MAPLHSPKPSVGDLLPPPVQAQMIEAIEAHLRAWRLRLQHPKVRALRQVRQSIDALLLYPAS